jgi:tRNA (adenine57-N1/adenine58-N1)-methyltransferase
MEMTDSPDHDCENRMAILLDENGRSYPVHIGGGMAKVTELGTVDTDRLAACAWGDSVEIGGQKFVLLEPSILDRLGYIQRKAQIILPKDSAQVVMNCDIRSGSSVVEIGTGSGAMTIVLANFVAPSGKVISYEERDDFALLALRNVRKAELQKYVEIKKRDAIAGIDEKEADAVVIDIHDSWNVVGNAYSALKKGGHIASYSPTFNQVEQTVKALRERGFSDVRSLEILQREIIVHDMGTRPGFEMLGHTGFLTFARKIK